jgi:hypothetical protein
MLASRANTDGDAAAEFEIRRPHEALIVPGLSNRF